jgi:MFS family permease
MNKVNYNKTFLLGFGFFAISITWAVYNAFMPKILNNYIESATVIGFIMTIDNYFALILQPAVGILSDRINTRYGKRMPFIMIGMPLAVIFILLLANYSSFITLIIFLVGMNLSMSIFRSPVVSLMPDITHIENRSMANSIINFMGGIGSVIAYFVGSILWNKNNAYPFYLAAILVFLSFVILFNFIKEKRDVINYNMEEKQKVGFIEGLKAAPNMNQTIFLLLGILTWFIGFNGIETFFTLYGEKFLRVSVSSAALSFTFISLSFLIFAIPAGIIGTKVGKKTTIMMGIVGMILCFMIIFFLRSIILIRIMFIFAGLFWALININSYPFVTDMAPEGQLGTFTGFYYLFASLASIVSPPLLGSIIDITGYRYMFLYPAFFFTLAFIFIFMMESNKTT